MKIIKFLVIALCALACSNQTTADIYAKPVDMNAMKPAVPMDENTMAYPSIAARPDAGPAAIIYPDLADEIAATFDVDSE